MSRNYDAIIFDFDGTLYDNYKIGKNLVLAHFPQMLKMKADRTIRKNLKGKDFFTKEQFYAEYYTQLSEATGMSFEQSKKWYETKYLPQMISILKKKYHCQNNVSELFDYLNKKGIKTAIFSDYNLVPERMKAVGIEPDICKNLYSSVELGGLKPAAGPFKKIAGDLEIAPEKILVIGDRDDTDGQGARNCGMQFIQIKIQATKIKAEDVNHPLLSWNEICDFIKKD